MELIILSQNNCAPCKAQKQFMKHEDIKFTEINLSENPDKLDEFNVMSTPVTVLMDEGEEVTRVQGFDREQIMELAEYI